MLRTVGRAIVAVLLLVTALAVLLASPVARVAAAWLPSFVAAAPALLLATC